MIVRLEQISRHPEIRHVFRDCQGVVIGEALVPKAFIADFWIFKNQFQIETETFKRTVIYRTSIQEGLIVPSFVQTKKVLFLPVGYEYYQYSLYQQAFQVFESGLGENQHYYNLYHADEVIGVIHKDDLVRNYCNTYTLYAASKETMEVLCVFSMFMESTLYVDRTAGLDNVDDYDSVLTAQKELREKYDPTFIPRIKAMDGII